MIFLGLICVQSVASRSLEFPRPYIDLLNMSKAQKIGELKKAGYPAYILDTKTNSVERNHKKYTKTHMDRSGNFPTLETITYDIADPIIFKQALFHKELVEKIKDPVIFPYETIWFMEDETVTAVLKKTDQKSLESIGLTETFDNLMKLYSRSLSVLQKLEENNAALASFDKEGILCESYTQLKPFILADIYKIGDKRYVTTYEYLAQFMFTSPNIDNLGYEWGLNAVGETLNAKLMVNYILKQPYMTRYQLSGTDVDKLDKFMMDMYEVKKSFRSTTGQDTGLKNLMAYIASDGETSLLTKPEKARRFSRSSSSSSSSSPDLYPIFEKKIRRKNRKGIKALMTKRKSSMTRKKSPLH